MLPDHTPHTNKVDVNSKREGVTETLSELSTVRSGVDVEVVGENNMLLIGFGKQANLMRAGRQVQAASP